MRALLGELTQMGNMGFWKYFPSIGQLVALGCGATLATSSSNSQFLPLFSAHSSVVTWTLFYGLVVPL